MAKHGGYPGGMGMGGNMQNLMKQAQKMQQKMQEQQEEFEKKEFTASAGGDAVKATVNGKHELLSLVISPEIVDPDDIEMLQDLVTAAVNSAMKLADAEQAENMSKLTGGMGGFGGLF